MRSKGINSQGDETFARLAGGFLALLAGGRPDRLSFVGGRAALILAVLPFEGALRIAVFVAIFAILDCALLRYLFKRYKNFKLSKLFVKNPNLSLLLFAVENLSLGAFYCGFSAYLAAGYLGQQYERAGARRSHLHSCPFV